MMDRPEPVFLSPSLHTSKPSSGPYAGSGEHLRDELTRIDLLVRAQVVRWRLTLAAHKPENLWGMVHVTEAEIGAYLDAPVASADYVPQAVLEALRPFWAAETEAAECIRAATEVTTPDVDLRLERLCTELGLNGLERDIVLVCLLPEIDFRYRRIFGYLQDDASRTHPPVELVLMIVYPKASTLEAARHVFGPEQPLRRNRIVTLGSEHESRAMCLVQLDDRIVSFLLGSDEFDTRLRHALSGPLQPLHWDQLLADGSLIERLQAFPQYAQSGQVAVMFHGPYGSGCEKAARAIATEIDVPLLRVSVEAALRDPERWELIVDIIYREARLLGAALYFSSVERLQAEDQPPHRWDYLLDAAIGYGGLTFFASANLDEKSRRFRDGQLVRFDFPLPHYELRVRIWIAYLPDDMPSREGLAAALAAAFQLTEGQVRDVIAAALALARRRSASGPVISREDLYEACRRQAGRRLLRFARRIEPTRQLTLDDVILSAANQAQLRELMNRVRLRSRIYSEMRLERNIAHGRGLVVLFAGPSGTGKTLSAELVANQQGVDLYKVDLSAVVSKWVGETEKNLNRVFSEAEDSDALLFFDECDSLFGQRGDISEAHDRWANLQVNYLLQRVEEYPGVVILATNLRQNIDEAFLRRIQIIVEFPSPDASLRFKIWTRALPGATTVISDDELHAVADRFALNGGSIRNASIDAAFRALGAERNEILLRDVVVSIAREYQKIGKPITKGEFGEQFYGWALEDILVPV
jgi:ATP-dependent 26S proteasome regulatory subunit